MSNVTNDIPARPVQQDDIFHLTFSQLHHIDRLCIKYLCRLDRDGRVFINVANITSQTGVPGETFMQFNTERRRAWRSARYLKDKTNPDLLSGSILKISGSTDDESVTLTFDQLHLLGLIYENRYEKDRKFPCCAEKKQIGDSIHPRLKTLSSQDMDTFFLTRRETFKKLEIDEETYMEPESELKKRLEEQEKELNETKTQLKLANDSVKAKEQEIESLTTTIKKLQIENNKVHDVLFQENDYRMETKSHLKLANDTVKAKDEEIESLKKAVKKLHIESFDICQILWTEKIDHTKTETELKLASDSAKTKDRKIESLKKTIERITIEKDALHEDLCSEEDKHAETRKGLCNAYIFNAKILENLKKTIQNMKDSEEKKVNDLESKLQEKQDELNNTVKLYWNLEKIITEKHCEALIEKKYGAEKKAMEKKIQEFKEMLKTQKTIFKKMQDVIYN
ncbi:hypothetical protein GCK72_015862 [Caenorhabditis remanei]|uniref:Uncharacterized protein n=1 Tax=Caenorhabditis remanei TaxID=31234 RepID=A0A6A5GXY1_CAERE|nr:hypothetical protein GCK72_015862 [Caenorhabditis remanei]KAF1759395.1 hypothetical protein GCK72_015862 [Caenorhabditis remanei]